MATKSAQAWAELGKKKPGEEGYRPDVDANFNGDFMEYASPERSGVDQGFYVGDRGLPWHVSLSRQLGTPELMADAGKLLTTAEAIKLSGLDFTVERQPITPAGSSILIPNKWVTIRTDTGAPLGIVGPSYKVAQNKDAFSFADTIVDSGEAKWETAGVMRGGTWTFISMELDHLEIQVPGDPSPMKTYLLVINSHDGSRKIGGYVVRVRTVCQNTSELARKGAISRFEIKHSGTLEGKIAEARKALGIAFKNTEIVKELTAKLASTKLLDKQVREIFEGSVWPLDPDLTDIAKDKHHSALAFQNYLSSPNLEGIRGTAWGAYNAVTEHVDHGTTYRGRTSSAEDVRADALLFGGGRAAKERALTALLSRTK